MIEQIKSIWTHPMQCQYEKEDIKNKVLSVALFTWLAISGTPLKFLQNFFVDCQFPVDFHNSMAKLKRQI